MERTLARSNDMDMDLAQRQYGYTPDGDSHESCARALFPLSVREARITHP